MNLQVSMLLMVLCGPGTLLMAQSGGGTSAALGMSTNSNGDLASIAIQPSLDVLKTAMDDVRTDKWKASAALRGEAESNLASIRRDVETTLPALLATADSAPGSAAKLLPAYRNVEALYDVLLRIATASKQAAPNDQSGAIDQALAKLDDGRRALGDMLQTNAVGAEKKVGDLQATLKAVPPPTPAPPPVVCPTVPTKKKVAKPAVAKPAN